MTDKNKDDLTLTVRLKRIREALKLKQKEFAARIKVSAPTYSEIEGGKYKPGYDFIYNIAREYNVNLYYLLYGEGDMFLSPVHLLPARTGDSTVKKEEIERFLYYFQRSHIVQYMVFTNFRKLMLNDSKDIEKEVEESLKKSREE